MAINSIQSPFLRGNGAVDPAMPAKTATLPSSGRRDTPVTEIDQVQLTPESVRLRQQLATSEKEPPMNKARIQELRELIAGGAYQVDAKQLASKILDFETALA